ncbi:MAG: DUF4185 domain-containing protein [Polyangiaceae bacterium]|nr:DUF4185 domain-containing protein [Polyangiaceae bacterium]
MRVQSWLIACLVLASCHDTPNLVASVNDIGTVPNPPTASARDVGFSVRMGDRSVWVFGDTLFSEPAADGFQWRSSTWSWTEVGRLGPFTDALGSDGKSLQLLPHTADELAFNVEHRSEPRRHTPWPQALVSNGERAVVFYTNMVTGPDGPWDFKSTSGSVATWDNADKPAERIEPALFSDQEPDWGAAAVLVNGDIFVYACQGGLTKPCKLARVPFDAATDRAAYRFYDGESWSVDWHDAEAIFDGAPLFSVHHSAYLDRFVAIYMEPGGNQMRLRTASAPEGPWSEATGFGDGMKPDDGAFDYALIAHPELARDDGAVEILSYTRPSGFLRQETRLVELRWR